MGGIGDKLKAAREAKGISLDQAAEDCKIRAKYLAALEDEEYDVIPGKVYVKGFLKNYALYLGLNVEEILLEYKSRTSVLNDEGVPKRRPEKRKYKGSSSFVNRKKPPGWRKYAATFVLALAALTTLIVFNYYWDRSHNVADNPGLVQDEGESSDTGEQGQNPSAPDEGSNNPGDNNDILNPPQGINAPGDEGQNNSQPPGEPINQNEGVKVVLSIKDQDCWVKVIVDGKPQYEGVLAPGQSRTFGGQDEIGLVLGNAGAVEVIHNGQNLGTLGPYGTVIRDKFTRGL